MVKGKQNHIQKRRKKNSCNRIFIMEHDYHISSNDRSQQEQTTNNKSEEETRKHWRIFVQLQIYS